MAAEIGIRHEVITPHEFDDPAYTQNATDRCFHCKTELYSHLVPLARQLSLQVIANGTNADDLGDYRPGLRAADDFQVRSPLAELGLRKSDVTAAGHILAAERAGQAGHALLVQPRGLWPAGDTRAAADDRRGRTLPPRTVARGPAAGALPCRCGGRIELPPANDRGGCEPAMHRRIDARLRELGFSSVTVDPAGYRFGQPQHAGSRRNAAA